MRQECLFHYELKDIPFYSLCLIIPLGLISNLVSAFLFITSQLRKKTTGQFFEALALVDNVVMIGEMCFWVNVSVPGERNVVANFMHVNDPACQLPNHTRSWWRSQMETFSALLAFCAMNSRQWCGALMFFDLRLNKPFGKQSWGWWFETPSCSLWRHCNGLCHLRDWWWSSN